MPVPGVSWLAGWRNWPSCCGPAPATGCGCGCVRPRWTPEVAEFFRAFAAVTIGSGSYLIAPFIDTFIVTRWLPIGSRTALYYADRINQLPLGVMGLAIGTVLLPEMSARLARNDVAGSDAAQNRAVTLSLLLTLPFLAVFVAIPAIIMRAVFVHGVFDRHAADLAAIALMAYGVGLPAMALVRPLQSTFYARHDTATPARTTLVAMACNIAIKLVLVLGLGWGIAGVALGTALGAWINVALLVMRGQCRACFDRSAISAVPCRRSCWRGSAPPSARVSAPD